MTYILILTPSTIRNQTTILLAVSSFTAIVSMRFISCQSQASSSRCSLSSWPIPDFSDLLSVSPSHDCEVASATTDVAQLNVDPIANSERADGLTDGEFLRNGRKVPKATTSNLVMSSVVL